MHSFGENVWLRKCACCYIHVHVAYSWVLIVYGIIIAGVLLIYCPLPPILQYGVPVAVVVYALYLLYRHARPRHEVRSVGMTAAGHRAIKLCVLLASPRELSSLLNGRSAMRTYPTL